MPDMAELEYILRLVIAAACGVMIGYERQNRSKVAGVRTHCVVAFASALMMILSKYAYSDVMGMYGDLMKIDPSRIASGVVSGIGFLGAGMIFVNKKTVTGLTTAAGVWATSGIGMAIGAGMYWIGGAATLVILLIQIILHITPNLHLHHSDKIHSDYTNTEALPVKQAKLINIYPSDETDENGRIIYKATIIFPQEEADNITKCEEIKS